MTLSRPARRLAVVGGTILVLTLAAAPAIAADHPVSIVGKSFDPAQITIAAGDTVTWTVSQSIGEPHSVTSGKPGDADPGSLFDSGIEGLKDDGGTYQQTFDAAGTFVYYCTVHPAEMTGVVTVLTPEGGGEGIPVERRALAGGILVVALVILFGAASVWRRLNRA